MDKQGEAQASTPFAPKSALVRTPPSSFGKARALDDVDMALTPTVPPRPAQHPAPGGKRPLTSPGERRPADVVRQCRPATPPATPQPSQPSSSQEFNPAEEGEDDKEDALSKQTKAELLDLANKNLRTVMSAVTGPTSKLNKEATNAISSSVQCVLAVVATLSLRLSEREVELGEAKLQAAKVEKELIRAKTAPSAAAPASSSASASAFSYASALRISRKAEPVPIPAAQGPVLAFYPAPEHAATLKTAEDTKCELKRAIRPQDIQVQVDRLRKVGNAGVVVQTTDEASAQKLRKAVPSTLRVTEPKRRSPLVSLRHIDGDGDLEQIYPALHDQNFRSSEWTLERLRSQSKLAFKKRGRGTTTVVLECSPKLREALLGKERVYIGWQVVEVVDFLSVTCCRKCHQFGHPEKYCRSAEAF